MNNKIKKFKEYNDEIFIEIANNISKNIYCDRYGSCVHFAELFLEEIYKINPSLLKDINVIEGYVYTSEGKIEHTWIETKNGLKIDPTFEQFKNFKIKKITKKNVISGVKYFNGIKKSWFKKRRDEFPHYVFKKLKN